MCVLEKSLLFKFCYIYTPTLFLIQGKLKNGQDIAISGPPEVSSHRSTEECINEVSILVQVEHENLIQLLGYCIKGTGTYLIYDFAPYATLSSLLFGTFLY